MTGLYKYHIPSAWRKRDGRACFRACFLTEMQGIQAKTSVHKRLIPCIPGNIYFWWGRISFQRDLLRRFINVSVSFHFFRPPNSGHASSEFLFIVVARADPLILRPKFKCTAQRAVVAFSYTFIVVLLIFCKRSYKSKKTQATVRADFETCLWNQFCLHFLCSLNDSCPAAGL